MVLRRQNPYTAEATHEVQVAYYGRALTARELSEEANPMGFAYPPFTAFVCSWLAALPWNAASVLMLLASILLTAASVPLWIRITGVSVNTPLTTACVLMSWPALWGIRLEQLSMLVIAGIAAACWLYLCGHYAGSGFLLAVCAVKPQLVFLLAAWLIVRSWQRERRGFILAFTGTICGLVVASQLWLPGCFGAWLAAMRSYHAYTHVWIAFPILAFVAVAYAGFMLYRERDFGVSVALVLAATMAINPIDPVILYNYLLLVPAVLLVENWLAFGFVALQYLLPAVGSIFVIAHRPQSHIQGWETLLPIVLILTFIPARTRVVEQATAH